MTAKNYLQFQEGGHEIWITIPPKVEHDENGKIIEAKETQVVSLDNLYSASSDRRQQQETGGSESIASSKLPFVWKLYEMLEDVESSNQEDIVSWVRDGTAFKVHALEKFVEEIIPKYCKLSKYKSFQRQLYFYGFTRIQKGPDAGAYFHSKFVRGKKTMCLSMTPKNSRRRRSSRDSCSTSGETSNKSCTMKQAAQLVAAMDRSSSPSSLSIASREQDDFEDTKLPHLERSATSIAEEQDDTSTRRIQSPSAINMASNEVVAYETQQPYEQSIARELQDLLLEDQWIRPRAQSDGVVYTDQHRQTHPQTQTHQCRPKDDNDHLEYVFDGMPFHSV